MGFTEDMEAHFEQYGYKYQRWYQENGVQGGWTFAGGYEMVRYPDYGWRLTENGTYLTRLNDEVDASGLIFQLNHFDFVLKASLPPDSSPKNEAKAEPVEVPPSEECAVCLEKIPERVAIVPCGHTTVCRDCCLELDSCPLCRGEIKQVIKLF
jgi:hypothetical protein